MLDTKRLAIKKQISVEISKNKTDYFLAGQEYLVIGYGGVFFSEEYNDKSQPLVELICVNLTNLENNKKKEKYKRKSAFVIKLDVQLGLVKSIPIGTIGFVKQDGLKTNKIVVFKQVMDFKKYAYALQTDNNDMTDEYIKIDDNEPCFSLLQKYWYDFLGYEYSDDKEKVKKYGVYTPEQDKYTWIVSKDKAGKTFLLHPLTLLNAHYGVSSEIIRLLVSEPAWVDVEKKLGLHYDRKDGGQGMANKAVLIAERLDIRDCVFLHHLKNDEYSEQVVKAVHNNMREQYERADFKGNKHNVKFWLEKVRPYHRQPVSLNVKGIDVGDNTILVTQIIVINEPVGDTVYYVLPSLNNKSKRADGIQGVAYPKVIARNTIDKEVLIVNERVNNNDVSVIYADMLTVESVREKFKKGEVNIDGGLMYAKKAQYVVSKDEADRYAMGEQYGSDGNVGLSQLISGELALDAENFTGDETHQYQKLMDKCQKHFKSVLSFTINGGFVSGLIKPMSFRYSRAYPQSVLVLICEHGKGQKYIFVDCEEVEKINEAGELTTRCSSGITFEWLEKWNDSDEFLIFIKDVLQDIGFNNGVMSDDMIDFLKKEHVNWTIYHHTKTGDWVNTVLIKLNKSS